MDDVVRDQLQRRWPRLEMHDRPLLTGTDISGQATARTAPPTPAAMPPGPTHSSTSKIDVSGLIPKGALEAVTDAALPASVVQNIMHAAENSASELLTYEIPDILEEQDVDVERLLTEYDEKAGDGGMQSDDLAARRDSNTPPRSIRNVVDDEDRTAGIDPQRYAAHPKTDNIDIDNWN
ncbi:hypothetical protein [Corynebacterium freneyi]|uniref:hypothetical protein n=1 Tax=Corynebacterium freneyi TaxID=134034 RepID=UPI001CCD3AEF|nr:hypothetical protein [Corynebacterium freneyi]UBI01831.1 hypothetical protein LA334_10010 [Corynebacterium freneyi]